MRLDLSFLSVVGGLVFAACIRGEVLPLSPTSSAGSITAPGPSPTELVTLSEEQAVAKALDAINQTVPGFTLLSSAHSPSAHRLGLNEYEQHIGARVPGQPLPEAQREVWAVQTEGDFPFLHAYWAVVALDALTGEVIRVDKWVQPVFVRMATGEEISPVSMPSRRLGQLPIAPGVWLETCETCWQATLHAQVGRVYFYSDGSHGPCLYQVEDGRRAREPVLADGRALERIRERIVWWGLPPPFPRAGYAMVASGPPHVAVGVPVMFDVHAWGQGDCPEQVSILERPFDIAITKPDGTEIWRWSDSGPSWEPVTGVPRFSEPKSLLTVRWDQRDRKGQQVPEGLYLVRQWRLFTTKEGQSEWRGNGEAPLVIGRRPLLSELAEMRLEMPTEAKTAPVVLTLHVRNISGAPLRIEHMAIPYVFRIRDEAGRIVWVSDEVNFESGGTLLQPGQTRTDTVHWNLRSCSRRTPTGPCDVIGEAVPQGNYFIDVTFEGALYPSLEFYWDHLIITGRELRVLG